MDYIYFLSINVLLKEMCLLDFFKMINLQLLSPVLYIILVAKCKLHQELTGSFKIE